MKTSQNGTPRRVPFFEPLRERDFLEQARYRRRMEQRRQPSWRNLTGIVLILLLIAIWAAFVASLARIVGGWPVLAQAPFYLFAGVAWIIPLKPLVRWMQTGSFRVRRSRD